MQDFFNRIGQWAHWIVFLLLEGVSLVLLLRFNQYQGSVWFTQANTAAGYVLDKEAQVLSYIQLGEINRELTRENQVLQYNLDVLRHELAELKHDSTLTELTLAEQVEGLHMIPAQVINNSVGKRNNFITINRGLSDGVRTEMGVVCGTGVVGIVYMVSEHFSLVLPVLNSHSSISCRLRDTEYFGYLKWKGGSPLRAIIDDIPRHARIKKGDVVETSGFSSVFPAGIFVGKVNRVQNSEDGLSYQLQIQLSTDFARLRDVNVIADEMRIEVDTLQNHIPKE